MPEAIFKFKFEDEPDKEYELTRVTRSELSHFKSWYGEEYGQKITVITKAIWEDGDAVACLIWACRRENNLSPNPDPRNMPDFDPSEVFVKKTVEEIEAEAEARRPPLERVGSLSDPSTKTSGVSGSTEEIPTSSGGSGSPSSDTSVTSAPAS
jgi:hypothetical protein